MNKFCLGCGALMQNSDEKKAGYVSNLTQDICNRCFNLRNYNKLDLQNYNEKQFKDIFMKIKKSKSLIVLVIDLFDYQKSLDFIKELKNPVLLVITKKDLFKTINEQKVIAYFKSLFPFKDCLFISSKKNYNFDLLYQKIEKYKVSKEVYVVGMTSVGKSTLLNRFTKNYSKAATLTTSFFPSTTLGLLKFKINDNLTLIDTPGLIAKGSLITLSDLKTIKKLEPNNLKPLTYQFKEDGEIIVEDLVKISALANTNLTLYVSNKLSVKRNHHWTLSLTNLDRHDLKVEDNSDIVIAGLGFIHFTKKTSIVIYTLPNVLVYQRKSFL